MSVVTLLAMVVLGPILGWLLVGRHRWVWWLLAASLLPIVLTTLLPTDRQVQSFCAVQWSLPTPGRVELMANVVLFVAPALLLAVASRRPLLAAAAGSGLSAAIELAQALIPAIGRSCDTTDWTSNTIGAVIGAVLGWTALRLAPEDSGVRAEGAKRIVRRG